MAAGRADYLRDNLTGSKDSLVLRAFNYCIIDEVDSILVDEARTPLIISGPAGAPCPGAHSFAASQREEPDRASSAGCM